MQNKLEGLVKRRKGPLFQNWRSSGYDCREHAALKNTTDWSSRNCGQGTLTGQPANIYWG